MSVLVVGESLVDIVRTGSGHETPAPGGSPLNVAVALARLGNRVTLLTALGDDTDGELIRRHVEASGVRLESRPLAATSRAIATIREDGSAEYEFQVDWRLQGELTAPAVDAIHTGSIAMFLEPGASRVAELLRTTSSGLVTVDPNIRPALIGSRTHIVGRLEQLLPLVDLVKLSDEDAAWLYPERSADWVLERLRDVGAKAAVMTAGANGATLHSAAGTSHLPPRHTSVVDTIGAGDTFMGALIDGLLRERLDRGGLADPDPATLERIGRRAIAAASIAVSRKGADPPHASELDASLGAAEPENRASAVDSGIKNARSSSIPPDSACSARPAE